MVAEVIKLPSTTSNSFQPNNVGGSVGVINSPIKISQTNLSDQSEKLVGQASEKIEVIRKAASDLNEFAKQIQISLKFSVDEASGRPVITVTDSQTGEVIRQIPAKEILAVANLLREFIASDVEKVGLLLEDKG